MIKKLLINHPYVEKLNKIFNLMDDEGIAIIWEGSEVGVKFRGDERMYTLKDLEAKWIEGNTIDVIPPSTEFKILYDDGK